MTLRGGKPANSREAAEQLACHPARSRRIHLALKSITAYVYILASDRHGTLYTGVTSDLVRRMYQHREHVLDGFTSKYDVTRLVWYLQGDDIAAAIALEKKIKNRSRRWKVDLIERLNPGWNDLTADWTATNSAKPVIPRAVAESTVALRGGFK